MQYNAFYKRRGEQHKTCCPPSRFAAIIIKMATLFLLKGRSGDSPGHTLRNVPLVSTRLPLQDRAESLKARASDPAGAATLTGFPGSDSQSHKPDAP